MDNRCRSTHGKLLAGKCPWCGQYIIAGKVEDAPEMLDASDEKENPEAKTLQQFVNEQGLLSFDSALTILKLIAEKLFDYHKTNRLFGGLAPHHVVFTGEGILITRDASSLLDALNSKGFKHSGYSREVLAVVDYLAPEQALSAPDADSRADIYSLGCILYFMLMGRPPFPEGSVSERLLKHQIQTPTNIRKLRPDASPDLVQVCEKMLAKSPKDRYQSAIELLAALKAL